MTRTRSLILSAHEARAAQAGTMTQIRRLVKLPSPSLVGSATAITDPGDDGGFLVEYWARQERSFGNFGRAERFKCPFGRPGDRLAVKEALTAVDGEAWVYSADSKPVQVSPEDETAMIVWCHHKQDNFCRSVHMPIWASRTTLELLRVRVERVSDISEKDAKAAKAKRICDHCGNSDAHEAHWICEADYEPVIGYRVGFKKIWDSLHPGSWARGEFVWVVDVRKAENAKA